MRRQDDEFGDARALRSEATRKPTRLGHTLRPFVVRIADATKADAFCERCNLLAVVNTSTDGPLPSTYGRALKQRCSKGVEY